MSDYVFDADTAVTGGDGGVFQAALHERWTIENVPNGGYTMAVMLRACHAMSAHPDPLTATAHFLSPTKAGSVEMRVEEVKAGRSTSTFMAALRQDGRERVRMLTTLGHLDSRDGPTHRYLSPPTLEPPFVEQRSMLDQNFPDNFRFEIPQRVAGGAIGQPTGEPEIGGRIAFADGRDPDLLAMPVFADGMPPAAFNLGYAAWTPTIELTVHFWNHPAPGPVTVWFHSAVVEGGYHDESGDIWDSEGRLVARSRQFARILAAPSP